MKDSDKQSLVGLFWTIGGLFVLGFYGVAFQNFMEGGPGRFTKADVLTLLLATVFAACMMYRFRRIVYYGVAVSFFGFAAITVLSLVTRIGDNVISFLIAPIGIKPEFQVSGFGDALLPLLMVTAVIGIMYFVARSLKEKVKELPTSGAPVSPRPVPSTFDIKPNSE